MVNAPKRPAPPQGGAPRPPHQGGNRPPFRGGGRPPFRGGRRDGRPAPKIIGVGTEKRGMSARTVEALQNAKNAGPFPFEVKGDPPKLKVYALGGLEEIGRNCTVFECGDDIVIVDAGLMFPEENMPGIDYIIPNVSSLKGKEKNIRGVIVSHGHLDHVGGLPFILPRLGFPTIYTAPLTAGIIRNRQEEFGNANQLKIQLITGKSRVQMGRNFVFEPFHVNHNISDAFGTALYTPYGVILGTGDFKFDFTPADGDPADLIHIAGFGGKGSEFRIHQCSLKRYPAVIYTQTAIVAGIAVAKEVDDLMVGDVEVSISVDSGEGVAGLETPDGGEVDPLALNSSFMVRETHHELCKLSLCNLA